MPGLSSRCNAPTACLGVRICRCILASAVSPVGEDAASTAIGRPCLPLNAAPSAVSGRPQLPSDVVSLTQSSSAFSFQHQFTASIEFLLPFAIHLPYLHLHLTSIFFSSADTFHFALDDTPQLLYPRRLYPSASNTLDTYSPIHLYTIHWADDDQDDADARRRTSNGSHLRDNEDDQTIVYQHQATNAAMPSVLPLLPCHNLRHPRCILIQTLSAPLDRTLLYHYHALYSCILFVPQSKIVLEPLMRGVTGHCTASGHTR